MAQQIKKVADGVSGVIRKKIRQTGTGFKADKKSWIFFGKKLGSCKCKCSFSTACNRRIDTDERQVLSVRIC